MHEQVAWMAAESIYRGERAARLSGSAAQRTTLHTRARGQRAARKSSSKPDDATDDRQQQIRALTEVPPEEQLSRDASDSAEPAETKDAAQVPKTGD